MVVQEVQVLVVVPDLVGALEVRDLVEVQEVQVLAVVLELVDFPVFLPVRYFI
jgi:hypothetical protein